MLAVFCFGSYYWKNGFEFEKIYGDVLVKREVNFMQYKITQENLIIPEWKSEVEYVVDRKEKSEE
ncbi:hypothetical protein MKZ17_20450 [Solibacillus sp. FSL R7-0682]|uniref:hypothetical protein n=1 Tax=Solibacillus sp. FSL R7-0682 TaxID=2921690 RepID=UPI0030F71710